MKNTLTVEDYPLFGQLTRDDQNYLISVLWEVSFDSLKDLVLEVHDLLPK